MSYDIKILKGVVSKNHVHLLLSAPPTLGASKMAQFLKGKSSYKIQQEFPELKKRDIEGNIFGQEVTFVHRLVM